MEESSTTLRRGTILYHRSFQFTDGDVSDKLLIILNEPRIEKGEHYIVCRTTTNPVGKPSHLGFSEETSTFFIKKGQESFPEDTYVQLYELYDFREEEMIKDMEEGKLEIKGVLSEYTIKELMKGVNLSADISSADKEKILQSYKIK